MLMAVPCGIAAGYMSDPELGFLIGYLIVAIGAVYGGYTYFEKYGPLFLSHDGKAIKNIFKYSIGFGLVTVYPFTVISLFAIEGVHLVVQLLFVGLAIPLSGMKFIGAFALGRFFNK